MNFPLQQSDSETTKNTVDKVQKRKKEREGANNECTAKLPSEGGGDFLSLLFLAQPSCLQCNAHLLKAACKMNDSSFFKFESVYLCI